MINHSIALVGDYVPRKCGIATFMHDLCHSLAGQGAEYMVVAVNDRPSGYDYPPEVRFEIDEQDVESYRRAADFLNYSNPEVVCVEHEFGIYGGRSGDYIIELIQRLEPPAITHLHTILSEPTADQMRVMREIIRLSSRMIVMCELGRRMLVQVYDAPPEMIDVIPHGIHDMPFVDPNYYKEQFGVEGKRVLLTFGLIAPNKGLEFAIRALPEVVREFPDLVYMIVGATHPNLVRESGETYRLELQRLAAELGVQDHVIFHNHFVEIEELKEILGASDVYIAPYLNQAQITSGALAYAFGCGKAVISTPFWHAEELLADGRGVLVPFRDSSAISRELTALLKDDARRHSMRKNAYRASRAMIWSNVACRLVASFDLARRSCMNDDSPGRSSVKHVDQRSWEIPRTRIGHLQCLSDSTGVFQHATFALPNYREGYCADDNARALMLAVRCEEEGEAAPEMNSLASTCAAFLNHAWIPESGRFHNFMSYSRRWVDECGSDDCLGRALLALGVCIGRSQRDDLRNWAMSLFDRSLQAVAATTSPRAWALALAAIHEYSRRFSGDRNASRMRDLLACRLIEQYHAAKTADWDWFEAVLSYDNARLPLALILGGRGSSDPVRLEIGLRSLRWLMKLQTAPAGHFRPIGSNGFYPRGGVRADLDQQPIEALASTTACMEAWRATNDIFWMNEATRSFEWFLGRNDLGQPLFDAKSGACFDGLHVDRLNLNQGAESTLAFLLAAQEIRRAQLPTGILIDRTSADRSRAQLIRQEPATSRLRSTIRKAADIASPQTS